MSDEERRVELESDDERADQRAEDLADDLAGDEDEDEGATMTLEEVDIEAPEDDVAEQRQVVRQEDDEYR